jgi:hypothetical protein
MKRVVSGWTAWLVMLMATLMVAGCSSSPAPILRLEATGGGYDAGFDRTWNALNDVLTEKRLPLKSFEKDSGLVSTDFVNSGSRYVFMGKKDDSGRDLSQWAAKTRYFLNIRVRADGEARSTVDVIPHFEYMRYVYDSRQSRYVEAGWEPCDSHGDVERDIHDALAAKLK